MAHYSRTVGTPAKTVQTRVEGRRLSYKNTRETVHAIKGMPLAKAEAYLNAVVAKKSIVPFVKYNRGVSHKAQCKQMGVATGKWPEKSARLALELCANLRANAVAKGLSADEMIIRHAQVNEAPGHRRRTFRAHGRISKYSSSAANVELIAVAPNEHIEAAGEAVQRQMISA